MTLTHAHLQDSSTPLTTSLNCKWSPGDCGSGGGPGTRSFSLVARESKEPMFQDAFSGKHFSWSGRGKDVTGVRDRISPQVFSDCPLHIN